MRTHLYTAAIPPLRLQFTSPFVHRRAALRIGATACAQVGGDGYQVGGSCRAPLHCGSSFRTSPTAPALASLTPHAATRACAHAGTDRCTAELASD